jgi:hypothetical protein
MEVAAKTFRDDDRQLPPETVRGELVTRYVPTLDYTQYWINGVQVDPETVTESVYNEGMHVPELEEGEEATERVLRKRSGRGKTIGVFPPGEDEDLLRTEGETGQESLREMEEKADEDNDAPPRNRR